MVITQKNYLSLGKTLRSIREQKKITQVAMGELMGVPQGFVSQIEGNRKEKTPNLATLFRYLGALHYTLRITEAESHVTLTLKNRDRLGAILSQLREKNGLSQEEVGRKMKVQQSYVAQLESEKEYGKTPLLPTLLNYLSAIHCGLMLVKYYPRIKKD